MTHHLSPGLRLLLPLAAAGAALVALALSLTTGYDVHLVLGQGFGGAAGVVVASAILGRGRGRTTGLLLLGAMSCQVLGILGRQITYQLVELAAPSGVIRVALVASDITLTLAITLILATFLTFPNGRLPGGAWRPVAAAYVAGQVGVCVVIARLVGHLTDPRAMLESFTIIPEAFDGGEPLIAYLETMAGASLLLFVAVSVSLVRRYARAVEPQRSRIGIVAIAGAVNLVLIAATLFVQPANDDLRVLQTLIAIPEGLIIPVAFGLAVLRDGMFEIDVMIRRSAATAGLWGLIVLVYTVLTAGVGMVAGARFPLELAIGITLLVTLLVQPAQRRVAAFVDRVANRRSADAALAARSLATEVADANGVEAVAERLADLVMAAIAPAAVLVEVGEHVVRRGRPVSGPRSTVELQDGRRALGTVTVQAHDGRALRQRDLDELRLLCAPAGAAVARVLLARRLVRAQEAERRRIESVIRHGPQARIEALASALRDPLIPGGAEMAHLLADTADELAELAAGLHPPVLAERGLAAAVRDRAARMPIDVSVDVAEPVELAVLDATTSACAYFMVSEAVTNVIKHADASSLAVRLHAEEQGDELIVEVRDDGVGLAPAAMASGSGLQGLQDRATALGGSLVATSAPAGGTTVRLRLPLEQALVTT